MLVEHDVFCYILSIAWLVYTGWVKPPVFIKGVSDHPCGSYSGQRKIYIQLISKYVPYFNHGECSNIISNSQKFTKMAFCVIKHFKDLVFLKKWAEHFFIFTCLYRVFQRSNIAGLYQIYYCYHMPLHGKNK